MDISTVPTMGTDDLLDFQSDYLWALVVGFHLSFLFAAAMGANEVSNAFASSVGSGAISLRVAYVLATVVESAGGILLGYKVLETLRFKIIDLDMYEQKPAELLLGQVAILGGSALWMAGATMCLLPVSSTHSHIGAIVGFSLLMRGPRGLHLRELLKIVVSWVVSPLLSGIVSALLYVLFDFAVFRRNDPLKSGFRAMPIFYFCVFTFNTFMIVYQGSKWLGFDRTPLWLAAVCSIGIGLLAALIFQFFIRQRLLKWVRRQEELRQKKEGVTEAVEAAEEETRFSSSNGRNRTSRLRSILPDPNRKADPQTLQLFSAIQVFTGCFTGFSHGSKDIPNTIAPLATLFFVFSHLRVPLGQPQETPLWFLAYGALATCIGFWLLGHKVIRTVGHKFTVLSPFSGFCVELGAALTVLCASKLGIPVSMTLCVVGSVVAVGAVRGSEPVNWALFRNVFIAWLLTFPLSALFSAALMFLLKMVFL